MIGASGCRGGVSHPRTGRGAGSARRVGWATAWVFSQLLASAGSEAQKVGTAPRTETARGLANDEQQGDKFVAQLVAGQRRAVFCHRHGQERMSCTPRAPWCSATFRHPACRSKDPACMMKRSGLTKQQPARLAEKDDEQAERRDKIVICGTRRAGLRTDTARRITSKEMAWMRVSRPNGVYGGSAAALLRAMSRIRPSVTRMRSPMKQ